CAHVPIAGGGDDGRSGSGDARHFRDSIDRGIDILKHVFAIDAVEGGIGKRKRWKRGVNELDRELLLACARARALDELSVDVDAGDSAARAYAAGQFEGGMPRSGADIK